MSKMRNLLTVATVSLCLLAVVVFKSRNQHPPEHIIASPKQKSRKLSPSQSQIWGEASGKASNLSLLFHEYMEQHGWRLPDADKWESELRPFLRRTEPNFDDMVQCSVPGQKRRFVMNRDASLIDTDYVAETGENIIVFFTVAVPPNDKRRSAFPESAVSISPNGYFLAGFLLKGSVTIIGSRSNFGDETLSLSGWKEMIKHSHETVRKVRWRMKHKIKPLSRVI